MRKSRLISSHQPEAVDPETWRRRTDDRPVLRMQNAHARARRLRGKGFRIIDDEDYEDDDPELKGWHVMWKGGAQAILI